jgi:hypothetical protein
MKTCPECAEVVRGHAAVCRYCHYRFTWFDELPAEEKQRIELQQRNSAAAIGVTGFACIVGFVFLYTFGYL